MRSTPWAATWADSLTFSSKDKDALSENMLVMGMVKNGAITFAYPEDAKRNLFVQRKQ